MSDTVQLLKLLHQRVSLLEAREQKLGLGCAMRAPLIYPEVENLYGPATQTACKDIYEFLTAFTELHEYDNRNALLKAWHCYKREVKKYQQSPWDDHYTFCIEPRHIPGQSETMRHFQIIVKWFPYHRGRGYNPEMLKIVIDAVNPRDRCLREIFKTEIPYTELEKYADKWTEELLAGLDPSGAPKEYYQTRRVNSW